MATRKSRLVRSKRVETRVVRYLAGEQAARDWKEDHDIHVEDSEGRTWIGEVKSKAWPAGPRGLWTLLRDALEQAEKHSLLAFAVYVPVHAEIGDALVMVRLSGVPVIVTLNQFKFRFLGAEALCVFEDDEGDRSCPELIALTGVETPEAA